MSLKYLPQFKTTTLSVPGGITDSQTSGIILADITGVDDTLPGQVCINWSSTLDTDVCEYVDYTSINSSTKELQGVTRGQEGISAKTHDNQVAVAFVVSKSHINEINDKLTGRDAVAIEDSSGNEVLKSASVASAVNEITVKNAATGNAPSIAATGGDTNIDLDLIPKGSGDVNLNGSNKNIKDNGSDPWRTISIFGGLKPTTTSGCASKATVEAATNDIDYDVLDFDASSDENAFVNFQMPDSYDGGIVQFRYVWTNAGGGSAETVVFELSGRAFANDDAIDQVVGTPIEVSDTWIAQGDVHISSWSGDVTIAGSPAGGQWVHFEIMRDVSEDNLTGDARLMDVQIRYKQAQYGD